MAMVGPGLLLCVKPRIQRRRGTTAGNHRAHKPDCDVGLFRPIVDVGLICNGGPHDLAARTDHIFQHRPANTADLFTGTRNRTFCGRFNVLLGY